MEKRRPTYDLEAFKAACAIDLKITGSAVHSAAEFGFDLDKIEATIQTMEPPHFYKSMTAYGNHRTWQDVYHVPSSAGLIYLKFRADALTEFMVLSFKEKDNG